MTLIDDVRTVREENVILRAELDLVKTLLAKQDEQINGERGMSAAINNQTSEIRGLRKAAYWVAGLIVAGAISFAFSVLLLIPQ